MLTYSNQFIYNYYFLLLYSKVLVFSPCLSSTWMFCILGHVVNKCLPMQHVFSFVYLHLIMYSFVLVLQRELRCVTQLFFPWILYNTYEKIICLMLLILYFTCFLVHGFSDYCFCIEWHTYGRYT